LKAAGLLRERPRRVNEPSILFLTRHAFPLLSETGNLGAFPQFGLADLEKRVQVSAARPDARAPVDVRMRP